MNNTYILNLTITKNNWECDFLDAIVDNGIFYTLEEAISYGKWVFANMVCSEYDKETITNEELDKFIKDNKIEYKFIISIVNNNRKRFNNSKDIMDYFNSKINSVSNDNLFEFLLSLMEYYDITYDYHGNIICEEPIEQCLKDSYIISSIIDFTIEGCKKGKYTFNYDII